MLDIGVEDSKGKGLLDDDFSGKVSCDADGAGWFEGVADEWKVPGTARDFACNVFDNVVG